MRLEFDMDDPSRYVEIEWGGEEYRIPKASTLSVKDGREIVERAKEEKTELAAVMLGTLVERAGLTVEALDEMPRDMLIALYTSVIGDTAKK